LTFITVDEVLNYDSESGIEMYEISRKVKAMDWYPIGLCAVSLCNEHPRKHYMNLSGSSCILSYQLTLGDANGYMS
jgi:hypothetical protein